MEHDYDHGFAAGHLTARLARQTILIWTVAVACIGTLFSAMGSHVVRQSRQDDLGGFLGSQLGTGNPVAGYFGYLGTIVGMAVTSFAVLGVLRARQDEVDGLTDHVLTTGVRRWAPLAWQVAVTAVGTLIILVGATSSPVSRRISGARVPAWLSGHGGVDRPLSRITFRTSSGGKSRPASDDPAW